MERVKERILLIGLVVLAPLALGLIMPMAGNVIAEQFYGTQSFFNAIEQFFRELFEPESRVFFAFNVFPFAFYSVFSLIRFSTAKDLAHLDGGLAQWGGSVALASVVCALLNFLNLKLAYAAGSSVLFLLLYPIAMFPALGLGHYIGRALWRASRGINEQ